MRKSILLVLTLLFTFFLVSMGGDSAQACDLSSDLAASYAFSNTTYDSSGNDNHGTGYNLQITNDMDGNPYSAYEFDGTSSYISVPDSSTLDITNSITISAWVYWEGTHPDFNGSIDAQRIVSKKGVGHYSGTVETYALWIWPDGRIGVRFDAYPGGGYDKIAFPAGLEENQWYHIAVTYDGENTRAYVDGREVTNPTPGNDYYSGDIYPSDYTLFIGKWEVQPSNTRFFNGVMDEVRIYNRALTACEIWALYGRVCE